MTKLAARTRTRAASALPWVLLAFIALMFLLPTGPAYSLVFYVAVLPAALLSWRTQNPVQWGPSALGTLLILWSAATLLWGHDDGHRSWVFGVDAVFTLVFFDAANRVFAAPARRVQLATILIWCGTINAVLSIALMPLRPQNGDRMHGWGATSHPILGASVMAIAALAALTRGLTIERRRAAHLAAAAIMAGFIALTESRGPLLAVTVAAIFLCAVSRWRWRALGVLAAACAGWLLLPAKMKHHQAAVLVYRGTSHRLEIWQRSLRMIARHPIAGNGLAANLDLPGITFPHDFYLSVLFYSGAIGGLLLAGLLVAIVRQLWQDRRTRGPEWLWTTAMWISMLLSGLTDFGQVTKGPGPIWLVFWLPVSLVLARMPKANRSAAA